MTVESAKFKGKPNDLYLQKNSAGQVVSGFNLLNVHTGRNGSAAFRLAY